MNNDTAKSGVTTPEAPPTTPPVPRTENPPSQAQYPRYPTYPYPASPGRRPARSGSKWLAWVIGGTLGALVVVGLVITLVVALIGGFVFSTVGQHEQIATSTQTFAVSGTPSLVISDSAGNVAVQAGDASQVMVRITKHAWGSSSAVAQNGLANTAVSINQSGTTITVNARFSTTYFDGGPARRTVDVLVTVPAQANADVRLGAGNIAVRQITGVIRLDSGAGNDTVDNVTFANASRLNTGAGNVQLNGVIAGGATVDIHIGVGNATLTLPSDTPARLDASTGVGTLTITGWQIPVTGSGTTGHHASGDMSPNPTGTLTINVGTGNLTLMSR